MIVHPCLRCSLPELPIEVLRCPRCGEENFIPLNRTLSAPESPSEPINDTTGFCYVPTERIGEAKDIRTGCSPNQYNQTKPMWKDINFCNEEHTDGMEINNVEVEWGEGADAIKLRCRNTDLKGEQQLQNCSINPVGKNNTLQDIPTEYHQAYYFNADYNDLWGDSTCVNFRASVSAHGEEPKNGKNFSQQTQTKLENQSSIEMAVGSHYPNELSPFENEDGEIDFAGCMVCHKKFVVGNFQLFNMHQQSQCDLKPYKCEKCLCTFSFRSGLESHQKVHSTERPFKCDKCDYSFKHKNGLNKHILNIHTAKNNFV